MKAHDLTYRDYRSPFTRLGICFSESEPGLSFVTHECGYRRYENWNHHGIRSPYWRLHHNRESGNTLRCTGRTIPLEPDMLLITPADVLFDTVGPRAVPHLWVHFTPNNDFAMALREPLPITLTPVLANAVTTCIDTYAKAGDPDGQQRLRHICKGLLHLVFATLPREHFHSYPPRLYGVLEHIARHPGSNLANPQLAQRAGMGLRSFEYWFKRHMGTTPAAYVATRRMQAACRWLALSSRSIEQIADALGYPNRYYFTRVFARHLGCGPAAFRKGGIRTEEQAAHTVPPSPASS